ncbi:MAG: hypothetical protein V3V67_11300 [Myxococcota bacterium]
MNRQIRLAALVAAFAVLSGCAQHPQVRVPPLLDLAGYGTIGVIEFSTDAERDLGELATTRFLQAMQSAQSGVPVLELGSRDRVLDAIGHEELDFEAVRAIGDRYHVDTLLVGKLDVTEVRPRFKLSTALDSLRVKAQVEASLAVKLYAADSGATRWTRSARGAKTLAQVSVLAGGKPSVYASDPEDAYSSLVAWLVNQVTEDLRPHYARR